MPVVFHRGDRHWKSFRSGPEPDTFSQNASRPTQIFLHSGGDHTFFNNYQVKAQHTCHRIRNIMDNASALTCCPTCGYDFGLKPRSPQ
jgi:hypothetical protein